MRDGAPSWVALISELLAEVYARIGPMTATTLAKEERIA
jgi:hypothetical protein